MTANELADKLENNTTLWGDCTYEQHDNDKYFKEQAATMLRQQQAEIEKLKGIVENTIKQAFYEDDFHRLEKEMKELKAKLENLPMSLKDDIEYWSEKITCNKCNDTGWVCEWHPDKEAHKCCGGAGMPCECIGGEK
jgi:ElaB/YqjD/DUF883 family membrane-anchored ribosome-binding protein